MALEQRVPILIIGGGIGGLAAARALSLKGRRVHVVEQAAAFGEIGAGLQLAPNALRALERLQVLDLVCRDAVFPRQLLMMDALSGERITAVELGPKFKERYGHSYAVMHRSDLHGHLLAACRESELVTLETDRRVVEITDLGEAAIVRCADRSSISARHVASSSAWHAPCARYCSIGWAASPSSTIRPRTQLSSGGRSYIVQRRSRPMVSSEARASRCSGANLASSSSAVPQSSLSDR